MKRILSIDGGGYLGLAAAEYIRLKEAELGRFHLYAGTSTGGIIACALAAGRKPKEIVQWYRERGREIFPHRRLRKALLVIKHRYPSKPLETALQEFFGDMRLTDVRNHLIIPTHDMARGTSYFFREDKPGLVWEAARATSAAPTYFAPYCREPHTWIDGGIYMNNPSLVAYRRARQLWPNEEYEIVSIGTGRKVRGMKPPRVPWLWVDNIIKIGMSGSADKDEYVVRNFDDVRFTRVNFTYPRNIDIDDTRPSTQRILLDAARREAERMTALAT